MDTLPQCRLSTGEITKLMTRECGPNPGRTLGSVHPRRRSKRSQIELPWNRIPTNRGTKVRSH